MKKQKQTRERATQGRGATFIITEMAVFTQEKDYSCETGYPFDDSRQIGNIQIYKVYSCGYVFYSEQAAIRSTGVQNHV